MIGLDRREGPWNDSTPSQREITYNIPFNNPLVKAKEIEVKETNTILQAKDHM
jgi:hypothetical protein